MNESIHEVYKTLIEAFVLVFIVVLVFLQDWRTTIIPMIAVPVSLIGTFAVMAMLGFLAEQPFALRPGVGHRHRRRRRNRRGGKHGTLPGPGHSSREAARLAMAEVSGPVIAIALVLCAVFVPTALMAGISGEFFRQFALTIAASTIISAFNSLTLSPALGAILFKGHGGGGHGAGEHAGADHGEGGHAAAKEALPRWGIALLALLLAYFVLTPHVAHLLGIELPGATAKKPVTRTPRRCGGYGWGAQAGGAVVGWLLAGLVNRALGAFFAAFNWVFDRVINVYGWNRRGAAEGLSDCPAGLWRTDGLDLSRLPGRSDRVYSRPRQGIPRRQCAVARRRQPGAFGPDHQADERDRPQCGEGPRRLAHDRPSRLLGLVEHEHQQRGRHVCHSGAL